MKLMLSKKKYELDEDLKNIASVLKPPKDFLGYFHGDNHHIFIGNQKITKMIIYFW